MRIGWQEGDRKEDSQRKDLHTDTTLSRLGMFRSPRSAWLFLNLDKSWQWKVNADGFRWCHRDITWGPYHSMSRQPSSNTLPCEVTTIRKRMILATGKPG